MAVNRFNPNELVYLRASAVVGFLESYLVASVHQVRSGVYVYQIDISARRPEVQTVGDRITLGGDSVLYFGEDELLTYCEAQELIVTNLERRLAVERARLQARCPSGSAGSVV
jgi:hypothetical protein